MWVGLADLAVELDDFLLLRVNGEEERASTAHFLEAVGDRCDGIEHVSTNLSDSVSESFSKDEVVMVDTGDCGWLISRKDCILGRRRRRRGDEELIYGRERLQREFVRRAKL